MMIVKVKLVIILLFVTAACFLSLPKGLTQTKMITAGEKFKNIKVLNDMPADQLGKVMNIMSSGLNVDCKFCHVSNNGEFEKDDNEHKQIAREMIKMTFEINKNHFNGKQEVSCNTCHNGRPHPSNLPNLSNVSPPYRIARPKIRATVQDILAKYKLALGGQKSIDAIRALFIQATRIESDGKTTEAEEISWHRGGKMSIKTSYGEYVIEEKYDGKIASKTSNGTKVNLHLDELEQIEREARLFVGGDPMKIYSAIEYRNLDKINDRDVFVLNAKSVNGVDERLYFDSESGLLVRRVASVPTVIGDFQYSVDYSDYKNVQGVNLPMTVRFAMPAVSWTRKVTKVTVK